MQHSPYSIQVPDAKADIEREAQDAVGRKAIAELAAIVANLAEGIEEEDQKPELIGSSPDENDYLYRLLILESQFLAYILRKEYVLLDRDHVVILTLDRVRGVGLGVLIHQAKQRALQRAK